MTLNRTDHEIRNIIEYAHCKFGNKPYAASQC
jgi:hypothetical protein